MYNFVLVTVFIFTSISAMADTETVRLPIKNEDGISTRKIKIIMEACAGAGIGALDGKPDNKWMIQIYRNFRNELKDPLAPDVEQIRVDIKFDYNLMRVTSEGRAIDTRFYPDGSGGSETVLTFKTQWDIKNPQLPVKTVLRQSPYLYSTLGDWINLAAKTVIPYIKFSSHSPAVDSFGRPILGEERLYDLEIIAPKNYDKPDQWINMDNNYLISTDFSFADYVRCLKSSFQ